MATSDIQIAEHALQHHFADMEQQRETSTFGMWMFLLTEIMFFGGLFCAYLVYRASYYQAFVEGSQKMNIALGATNTAVLICSSLSMALAVRCAQLGKTKMMAILLVITIIFGFGFLGIKAIEYHEHWENHEFPGPNFHFQTIDKKPPVDAQHTEIYFSLYWAMTGLHALHMIIGIGLVTWIVIAGLRGAYSPAVLQSGGKCRIVLALRRSGVDLFIPAALFDQQETWWLSDETRSNLNSILARTRNISSYTSHLAPISMYVGIWAALMVGHRADGICRLGRTGHLQHRAGAADRDHQGHAGGAVLHAPALQHQADHGDGGSGHFLPDHPVLAEHDRLPDARLARPTSLIELVAVRFSGAPTRGAFVMRRRIDVADTPTL